MSKSLVNAIKLALKYLKISLLQLLEQASLKGTVSRDFRTQTFFNKQLLLVPLEVPQDDFEFFS